MTEIKTFLDNMAAKFNVPEFIEQDPVQYPRRYKRIQDIEISAFLTATISWGKRSIILKSARRMHEIMGTSPYDYVMSKGYEHLGSANIHRTFFEDDMAFICRGLRNLYLQFHSCEALFCSEKQKSRTLWDGLAKFRSYIEEANNGYPPKSMRHISNPQSTSACKRLHLALRWLVRKDNIVDLGIWRNITPSELMIPLDVHVGNTARKLGLLRRRQNDRIAVEELTTYLRTLNPEDPVLYDFALFGVGETRILS